MKLIYKKSLFLKIHVRKQDSAYVYFIFESYEGWLAYSTLKFQSGDPFRVLELRVTPDFLKEVRWLLNILLREGVVQMSQEECRALSSECQESS
jgi:hypothetical protein